MIEHCVVHWSNTYISGVLDLFFPLKNSGRARRSMAWTLEENQMQVCNTNFPHSWTLKSSNTTSCGAAFHFNEFTFLFLIQFSHGKKAFLFLPVIVKPGCVARNDDVMGLLSHIVLVEVWAFHWLALHTRGAFLLFLLFIQTYSWAHQHRITAMILSYVLLIVKVPFLLFPWTRLLAHLLNHTKETRAWKGQ